jgi:hypothetical protein
MKRWFAGLFLLLTMVGSGAYAVPSARVTNGVRVEIAVASERAVEAQAEPHAQAAFPAAPPAVRPAESPAARSRAGTALYQRPPPAAL